MFSNVCCLFGMFCFCSTPSPPHPNIYEQMNCFYCSKIKALECVNYTWGNHNVSLSYVLLQSRCNFCCSLSPVVFWSPYNCYKIVKMKLAMVVNVFIHDVRQRKIFLTVKRKHYNPLWVFNQQSNKSFITFLCLFVFRFKLFLGSLSSFIFPFNPRHVEHISTLGLPNSTLNFVLNMYARK